MAAKTPSHWPITWTNCVSALFNLVLPLSLARLLSPDEMGRYRIFFLYITLSPALFLVAGFRNGLYYWVGKYPEGKLDVRQSWTLQAAITLLLCAIGWAISPWLAGRIKISPSDLHFMFLSIPLLIASTFLEDLMIARGRIWMGSWYSSGFNAFRAISLLIAAWWTRSVEGMFWVFFAGCVLRAVVGWWLLSGSGELTWLFSRQKSKDTLRYALPVSLAALSALALQNMDQLILSVRLSAEAFAFYSIGCLTLPPLSIFESSVNRVLIPQISQAFTQKDSVKAASLFTQGVSELFRFLLPASMGLILYSEPIIQILFTERYLPAANFLRLYALTYLFMALPYDTTARARGDGAWILRTTLIFAPLSIALVWLATGRWGAMGALIALLTTQLSIRLYSLGYQKRCFSASYAAFLPIKELAAETGFALVAAAGCLLLRPFFSDAKTWFFVTGPMFTAAYFAAVYAMAMTTPAEGPIRILELAQIRNGKEGMLYSLSETLHQHERFKVQVALYDHSQDRSPLLSPYEEAGIPISQWKKGDFFSFRILFRLVHMMTLEKTRILHVHDLGPFLYGSLATFCFLGRVRLFLTVHNLRGFQHNRWRRLYCKIFLRFADRIIAVSSDVRSGLLKLGADPRRLDVIPNEPPMEDELAMGVSYVKIFQSPKKNTVSSSLGGLRS